MNKELEDFVTEALNNKIKGLEQQIKNRDARIKDLVEENENLKKTGSEIITRAYNFKQKLEEFWEGERYSLPDIGSDWIDSDVRLFLSEDLIREAICPK